MIDDQQYGPGAMKYVKIAGKFWHPQKTSGSKRETQFNTRNTTVVKPGMPRYFRQGIAVIDRRGEVVDGNFRQPSLVIMLEGVIIQGLLPKLNRLTTMDQFWKQVSQHQASSPNRIPWRTVNDEKA